MSESHHQPKSGGLFKFSVTVSCLIVFLGAYGFIDMFKKAHGHWSLLEVAEKTVGLFESETVVFVKGEELDAHWTLGAARVLAKVLVLSLAGAGLISLFGARFKIWKFRKVSGHTLFIGVGSRGRHLALDALKKGRVAAIDLDEHNSSREVLTHQGILFLTGSGSDSALLAAARASAAKRVVIITKSDDVNSQIAEKVVAECKRTRDVSRGAQPVEVLVSIASPEYRELLRERWDLICKRAAGDPAVRLLGFQSVALRGVLLEMACEAGVSVEVRRRGATILVAGGTGLIINFKKLKSQHPSRGSGFSRSRLGHIRHTRVRSYRSKK